MGAGQTREDAAMATDGKIALVTGAGSGVGRAAALALLAAGYRVALAGRRREALEETVQLAGRAAHAALAVPTDVTDPASVDALFDAIRARFGRLDVLFNNAGGNTASTDFGDLTWEQWQSVIGVNLHGAFLVARGAYRQMREQSPRGGRIINNGSISAYVPRPGSAPYTASKHAITGLTRTISLDGRKHDIACGQLDIGNAATPMTARMARGVPQANGTLAPEPTMDVAEVGRAVVFMAGQPPDSNVQFMTIMATTMPFIGRG
jgi:NAD(P)-dependent dehydrogenase (short-subunit alcohol dehydrogenase family)